MTRPFTLALAFLTVVAAVAPPAGADDYQIDPSHTSVIFGISHFGYSFTYGRFNKVSGAYTLDPANPDAAKFTLAIDAASIDTNDAKRDEHLKSADFLSAGEFPVISFTSNKVTVKDVEGVSTYEVAGELTLHGVTRPVALKLQKLGEGPGPAQDYRSGFNCQTKLMRSEFGMTKMVGPIGDEVAITISFEGVRQGAPAATGARPTTKLVR